MRLRTILAVIGLSLSLGGCFVGTEPLLTPATADYPFYQAHYQAFPFERFVYTSDGVDATDTLERRGNVYALASEGPGGVELLLKSYGNDLYFGQLYVPPGGGDPAGYVYGAAVIDRDAMQIRLYRIHAQPGDFRPGLEECQPDTACLTDVDAYMAIVQQAIANGEHDEATLPIFSIR